MIDLHCHLLPGIDDGPGTLDEAVAVALASHESGVTTAVATPHYSHRYPTAVDEAGEALSLLRAALKERGCDLQVLLGCEIASDQLDSLSDPQRSERTLGPGDCLLIEPPFQESPGNLELQVNDLIVSGFEVLIAHPERSLAMVTNLSLLERLVERGARCSVTAGSLQGKYGKPVRLAALDLCKRGLVHNVASDAHDLRSRAPGLDLPSTWPDGLPERDELERISASLVGID